MWKDFRYKSPEEVAKEKEEQSRREKERLEAEDKLRDELDHLIGECDKADGMEVALAHLKEPEKIAAHINSNSATYLETFSKLFGLRERLKIKADYVDMKARLVGKPGGSSYRQRPLIQVPGLSPATPPTSVIPRSQEGNELRELANSLNKHADYYFNNRKELGDDDLDATPLTLFSARRVSYYLPKLADDKARLAYLLKLKNSFLRQDERGQIRLNGVRSFKTDKDFQLQLENFINTYREITTVQSEIKSATPTNTSKTNQEFTTKRKVLAIDYLLKQLGIKNITKKARADFIQFLIDRNHKEITNALDDSTLLNERNGTTAVFLRDWFEKLGLTEIVKDIEKNAALPKKK